MFPNVFHEMIFKNNHYHGGILQNRKDWEFHVSQQQSSNLNGKEYCKQHGLRCKSFYMHRKRILENEKPTNSLVTLPSLTNGKTVTFLPVGTINQTAMSIRLPDTTVIEFTTVPSPEHVAAFITALRGNS